MKNTVRIWSGACVLALLLVAGPALRAHLVIESDCAKHLLQALVKRVRRRERKLDGIDL